MLEKTTTKEQYEAEFEKEREDKEYEKYRRMAKSTNHATRNMARISLAHRFGEGDCPCNLCSRG